MHSNIHKKLFKPVERRLKLGVCDKDVSAEVEGLLKKNTLKDLGEKNYI